jgi:hypothetical protein
MNCCVVQATEVAALHCCVLLCSQKNSSVTTCCDICLAMVLWCHVGTLDINLPTMFPPRVVLSPVRYIGIPDRSFHTCIAFSQYYCDRLLDLACGLPFARSEGIVS